MSLAIKNSIWLHNIEIPGGLGSALNTAFADNDWRLYFIDDSGRNAGVPVDPQHWHQEVWSSELEEMDYKINHRFCVLMSPWQRTINSFNNTMLQMNIDPNTDHLNKFVAKGLKRSAKIPTFHNNHWRPQTEFYDDSVTLYDTNRISELIVFLKQIPGLRWQPKYQLIPENDYIQFKFEDLIPENQLDWYTKFENDWEVWIDRTKLDKNFIC